MYQLTQKQAVSLANSEARSLHEGFVDTLKSLKTITAPEAKKLYLDDIDERLARAQQLLDLGVLNGIAESRLKHMLSRSAAEYAALAKWSESDSTLIPTFRHSLK